LSSSTQSSPSRRALVCIDAYSDTETLVAHRQNSTKIVVLASRADCQELDYDQIVELSGIFTYDLSADALVRSLQSVCSGERVFPCELTLQSNSRPLARGNLPARSDADRLSPRETEILWHVAEGRSNKAIARVLGIAEATVQVHLKSLSRKIGVDNRTEAAIWTLANLPKAGSRASREAA
jgi:two-component system nitrate/nitrite response regulator NarL